MGLEPTQNNKRGESMDVVFKIGEIADMFEISVRALHLYDKMGLFKPEYIDDNTGYRYYTPDQIHVLNTILSFKKIGFSLAEIKTILDNHFSPEVIMSMLKEKIRTYQKQIDIIQFNIENMERMISVIEDCEERQKKKTPQPTEQEVAVKMSRISCLENIKLENFFSEILWL